MPFQQHEQTGLVWFTADVLNDVPHGFSTRKGGVSPAPWDSLNLRPGQGDGPEMLRENYRCFFAALGLDETRAVLSQQTHTANIRTVTAEDAGKGLLRPRDYTDVDALITNVPNLPLTVFSADCGIILLHDLTVTQLCRLFAADMVRRGVRGHILNMSSYSLWMPFPGLALYSASKAYMRSFSVAFAKEVRERGIRVTAVCPAGVATDLYGLTPYWQRIGRKLGVLITPDSCARRGLKALWKGRRCIVPDWWNRAWIPFCKVLPMWVLRPVRRFTMKFQK